MRSDSSSDDEDEEQNARIRSVAIESSAVINLAAGRGADNSTAKLSSKRKKKPDDDDGDFDDDGGLIFSQIRAQDLLHKHLDKSLGASFVEVSPEPITVVESLQTDEFDSEVRLFSRAPLGINLKRPERPKQTSRPKRYDSSDEDETEKVSRLQAAAVEGSTLLSLAAKAKAKAGARAIKAVEAAKKADKEEKQRVAKLRKERGEEWLPKVASDLRRENSVAASRKGQIGRVMDA